MRKSRRDESSAGRASANRKSKQRGWAMIAISP
jgi:hypothetical protein